MTERMAKVQQGAFALLCLVAHDDVGFHLHRPAHRLDPCGHIPGRQRLPLGFQPVKKRRIAEQPVFHHLAITGKEIARLERAKNGRIGQHQRGLMKGPHKVFALRYVDSGLAAHRTVHLRQQRCRDLHKSHTPTQDCGCKAHQIANHSAAQSDNNVFAFDLLIQHPIDAAR